MSDEVKKLTLSEDVTHVIEMRCKADDGSTYAVEYTMPDHGGFKARAALEAITRAVDKYNRASEGLEHVVRVAQLCSDSVLTDGEIRYTAQKAAFWALAMSECLKFTYSARTNSPPEYFNVLGLFVTCQNTHVVIRIERAKFWPMTEEVLSKFERDVRRALPGRTALTIVTE